MIHDFTHCVADSNQPMTDTALVDSEVVVMEDNDATTSLMSTEKIDLSEGIILFLTVPS